jgi:hypothetical protein
MFFLFSLRLMVQQRAMLPHAVVISSQPWFDSLHAQAAQSTANRKCTLPAHVLTFDSPLASEQSNVRISLFVMMMRVGAPMSNPEQPPVPTIL